ncbi:endonuclease/exonuclease/phosphatase family protein [Candidatus Spongiihabitans sp.]|uniref:endonuclease/exonuclease/phosphatase family protein n=1 Tax=Candidatus Spongiihabitans sp. TaxID=3101308 RepID=UPI003C6FA528
MKFVTYNIQYGKGKDGQVDLERSINEIAGADIIALQEVERLCPHRGNVDQAQVIAEGLRDYYWVYGAGVDLHVAGGTPTQNARCQFGNMLLSRQPILTSRHHLLPKYGSTDALSIQRSTIEATVQCGTRLLRLYSVHLTHLSSATRLPQVEALLSIHRNAVFEGAPISGDLRSFDWANDVSAGSQIVPDEAIMLGDFNFQPDSPEYDLLVGPSSDYGGRIANPQGFVDAWCAAGHDLGGGFTSGVNDQPVRLDYCFVSNSLQHRVHDCYVDDNAIASDHFPLCTEIDL